MSHVLAGWNRLSEEEAAQEILACCGSEGGRTGWRRGAR